MRNSEAPQASTNGKRMPGCGSRRLPLTAPRLSTGFRPQMCVQLTEKLSWLQTEQKDKMGSLPPAALKQEQLLRVSQEQPQPVAIVTKSNGHVVTITAQSWTIRLSTPAQQTAEAGGSSLLWQERCHYNPPR